ncbi:MAG: MBG domain-containing protein, partial [Gammaproteobacteria bacterium]|nr:MBG domain-containing protein [Gammaproteobacteria bacterium]
MKSNLKHFCYVLLLFLFSLTLFGCGDSTTTAAPIVTTTEEPVVTTTEEPVVTTTTVEAIDISKVKFYNGNFTYDGEAKSIYVSKRTIPEGVTVEYEGNEKTEVGEYTVTATLKDSAGNVLGTISAKLTINKVKKNISKVEFEDTAYDWLPNTTFKLEASEIPTGVKAEYENNTLTEVGSIEATCKLYDEFDNELLATLTATLKVKYAVVNDEDVFTSQTFLVDGEDHAITLDATKASEYTSIVYTNNSARVQGYYHASALVTEADGDMFEYHAILTLDNPVNEAFEDYADEMFVYFLSGDQSTLNIFMVDYESYGFEHEEATWYSYEPYTDEDYASDLEEIARL